MMMTCSQPSSCATLDSPALSHCGPALPPKLSLCADLVTFVQIGRQKKSWHAMRSRKLKISLCFPICFVSVDSPCCPAWASVRCCLACVICADSPIRVLHAKPLAHLFFGVSVMHSRSGLWRRRSPCFSSLFSWTIIFSFSLSTR